MKKLLDTKGRILAVLLPIIFLASCQPYDNSIHGTTVTASGKWAPMYDANGKIYDNQELNDTSYLVYPTWHQAWTWAGQRNDRWLFWLGIGILVIGISVFVYFNNKGSAGSGSVIPLMIAIIVGGCIIGGSLEWEKSGMQQEIRSTQYDSLMHYPGNLGPFWDAIPVK